MKTNASKKNLWQEYVIPQPIKLAALWTSLMSCYIYGGYFSLYVPGEMAGLVKGQTILNSPGKLLAAAVLLAVPALMIFLSVELKSAVSRRLNIALGVVYTLVMFLVALTSISTWRIFYLFLAVIEMFISVLIVIKAYKWPKAGTFENQAT